MEGEKAHLAYGDFDKEEIKTLNDRHNFSRSQIYKLVERVNKYGLEGLLDDPHKGRKQLITINQKEELRLVFSQKPIKKGYAQAEWDGPLLVKYMNDVLNLEYSVRQAQRLILIVIPPQLCCGVCPAFDYSRCGSF